MIDWDDLMNKGDLGPRQEDWSDRLAQAAYTPPSGIRMTFDYEDVAYTRTKQGAVFVFPGVQGQYVQDHGVSGHQIPLRVYISGPNHDKAAKVFEIALSETGPGTLEHPLYGSKLVVPFGDFTRRDDLVTGANQTVFEVTFFETFESLYPVGEEWPASAALEALDLYGESAALDFASALLLSSAAEELSFLQKIQKVLNTIRDTMAPIAAAQQNIAEEFAEIKETIDLGIDVLVADPLAMARATNNLIKTPARSMTSITARLDGYSNLAGDIASDTLDGPGGPGGTGPRLDSFSGTGNDAQDANGFQVSRLCAGACIAGAIASTIYTMTSKGGATSSSAVSREQANAKAEGGTQGGAAFLKTSEVLTAAGTILDAVDAFAAWSDANYAALAESNDIISTPLNVDSGESMRALRRAAEIAAGYLVRLSFDLRSERTMILDSPRSVLDLCAELYHNLTDLDFFIDSNDFSGDEILELPRGCAVKYYV